MIIPRVLLVAEHSERNGGKYLVCGRTPGEVMEDDGPTMIATYKFVRAERMVKRIQPVAKPKKKA